VDVFNFPQRRTNNTYQLADTLRKQIGNHSIAFGTDLRRVFLASELPRNSRPLVTFNGSPDGFDLCNTPGISCNSIPSLASNQNSCGVSRFCSPTDLAAIGGAGGFFQTLVLPGRDSKIDLRYNQLDFFVQDEWHLRPRISVSLGLRYEYNTTPTEKDNKIESTFTQPLPAAVTQLSNFIDGRTKIYDADKNNFAPRLGLAADLGRNTVLRGGFGLYYDQILGAVVSQSRNVFPTFTTINFGGGLGQCFDVDGNPVACNDPARLSFANRLTNPFNIFLGNNPLVQPGKLNTIN
jgi:outer membrane receptor protein involved in Fe transport